jgi:hypothetical protein
MKSKPLALGACDLCGRPMVAGASVDAHHFVPKCEGGRERTPLHRICHRKIHSLFTERELAQTYSTPAALLAHPDIQNFVRWVSKKPPEYYDRNRTSNAKRR